MNQEKKTYTKAEIIRTLSIQPYIMALWETQFGIETETTEGQSLYSAENLAKLRSIKELIYEKGYTIETAKKYINGSVIQDQTASETTIMATSSLIPDSKKISGSEKRPIRIEKDITQELLTIQKQLTKLKELL